MRSSINTICRKLKIRRVLFDPLNPHSTIISVSPKITGTLSARATAAKSTYVCFQCTKSFRKACWLVVNALTNLSPLIAFLKFSEKGRIICAVRFSGSNNTRADFYSGKSYLSRNASVCEHVLGIIFVSHPNFTH